MLKLVTFKEIREVFRETLQKHETKQKEMFTKHEKLVLYLISGHQGLLKQIVDQLCDRFTLLKTNVEKIKESLSFTHINIDQSFSKINE